MRVTTCPKGHFYDADKYPSCPHCVAVNTVGTGNNTPITVDTDPQPAVFTNPEPPVHPEIPIKPEVPVETVEPKVVVMEENNTDAMPVFIFSENNTVTQKDICDFPPKETDMPVSPAKPDLPSDLIAGWIVCIKGEYFGNAFDILTGETSVGKDDTNSIILSKDLAVSKEKHAWITYDVQSKLFYIMPGESSGLTYLNGELLIGKRNLSKGDTLKFGESEFIFVPLCDENFCWEQFCN